MLSLNHSTDLLALCFARHITILNMITGNADYVGCMRQGTANIDKRSKYYHESQRFFQVFPAHSYGGFYALSRKAISVLHNKDLRSFYLEGKFSYP